MKAQRRMLHPLCLLLLPCVSACGLPVPGIGVPVIEETNKHTDAKGGGRRECDGSGMVSGARLRLEGRIMSLSPGEGRKDWFLPLGGC